MDIQAVITEIQRGKPHRYLFRTQNDVRELITKNIKYDIIEYGMYLWNPNEKRSFCVHPDNPIHDNTFLLLDYSKKSNSRSLWFHFNSGDFELSSDMPHGLYCYFVMANPERKDEALMITTASSPGKYGLETSLIVFSVADDRKFCINIQSAFRMLTETRNMIPRE